MVFLTDRLYSEEELPNEFKLFVPQIQKTKKVMGVTPSFGRVIKENVAPNHGDGNINQNKSEIPEESLQHDVQVVEEIHDVEDDGIEASVDIAE